MNKIKKHKKVIICADDFGQNQAISNAVIALSKKNRLSATSCMTNLTQWPEHAPLLEPLKNIDKGVHINFTQGSPLTCQIKKKIGTWPNSLLTLVLWVFVGKLSAQEIEFEIEAQLAAFEKHTKQLPDFIDGHQHIHHFPIIRTALLTIYDKKYQILPFNKKPYLRISSCRPNFKEQFWFKKKLIQSLGSETLKKTLIKRNIPFNQYFSGIYPFNEKLHYQKIIETILSRIKDNTLLMCHPALDTKDKLDPIAKFRLQEYDFYLSDKFEYLCKKHNIKVSRYDRSPD